MGPVSAAENVGAIGSVDSGEESGSCGDAGGVANAPDDVGASRACSNVARPGGAAAGAGDASYVMAIVEAALAELDAGRIDAAKARLAALVTVVYGTRG